MKMTNNGNKMAILNSNKKEILINRPECVIDYSNQGIPPERIHELSKIPGLAIVEIAG